MSRGRWIVSATVVLLVIYAASQVHWQSAGRTMATAAAAPLIAAIVINVFSVALRGLRWWIFLRRVGPVSLATSVRGAIVGSGFNNLLVANGGDATRAVLVSRAAGLSVTSIVATLALDRLFDPICFGLLLFMATFVIPLPPQLSEARPIAGAALVAVLGLLVWLVRAPVRPERQMDEGGGWRARVHAFRQHVAFLATTRRLILAMAVSIAVWTTQIVTFALVARSVGAPLPLAGTIAALLLTNTGLVLRATPGNVGYFQFAYAVAAARFGISTETAVAAAMLLQLVQIVPVTLSALALAPTFSRRA